MIMKAPIVKSSIANDGEVVFPDLQDQRDADHQHYLHQFVKWLKENALPGKWVVEKADGFSFDVLVMCKFEDADQLVLHKVKILCLNPISAK